MMKEASWLACAAVLHKTSLPATIFRDDRLWWDHASPRTTTTSLEVPHCYACTISIKESKDEGITLIVDTDSEKIRFLETESTLSMETLAISMKEAVDRARTFADLIILSTKS